MKNSTNTESKNVINLQIMGFHGFYYSHFDSDCRYDAMLADKEYYESEYEIEMEIYKDITFDDDRYQNDVIENFVDEWKYGMGELVKSVSNAKIESPRFYNFETDKIYADIELADNWQDIIRDFIAANFNELQERIHKDWSDRSGFWSFIDNDIDNWIPYLFDEDLFDERYLEIMLSYYYEFNNGGGDALDRLNDIVDENVNTLEYVELTNEGGNKVEAARNGASA